MDFEKLEVWKRSCRLSVNLYQLLADCRDYGFKDQITRSGLSIPSNISEGMERAGNKEKFNFLNIAKASCAELRTQLYIGIEAGFIPKEVGFTYKSEAIEISKMLAGLMKSIKP